MIWQDAVISISNIIFSAALIPQIYYGFKLKRGPIRYQTSIPTFLGLYAMSYAFFTLSLYSSAALVATSATLWCVLFLQRVIYKK